MNLFDYPSRLYKEQKYSFWGSVSFGLPYYRHLKTIKMRIFMLAFVVASIFIVADCQLDHKYDNFNVDEILENQRILKNYIKCMLDKGPCTPEGKDFRKVLPEVIETACKQCDASQRQRMRKVTVFIRDKRPDDWAELLRKFDPEGKYKAQFDEFAKATD